MLVASVGRGLCGNVGDVYVHDGILLGVCGMKRWVRESVTDALIELVKEHPGVWALCLESHKQAGGR